ncbi:MAG: transketolase [Oligoflexales bacterium]|nr:transketolase [Oligoflexales bacterium]
MTSSPIDLAQDHKVINLLKGLVIDGVHKAQSGHPGGAMSSVDFAYILFSEFLNYDPDNPNWQGRDRFILSAGHESMLLYSLLHALGWLPLEELKNFRQWGSKTPGHPENHLTPGVECTTGPLGQGAAMSVGFAMAAAHMHKSIDAQLFANRTYAILGDGCIQEDITLGAASLAGHLKLDKLTWYYDRNRIQISGAISRASSDDEVKVFSGFGWNVIEINGHDLTEIRTALKQAHAQSSRPTLIIGNTTIANGAASLAGSAKTHGSPLPDQERIATKQKLELNSEDFFWPDSAANYFQRNFSSQRLRVEQWKGVLQKRLLDKKFAADYEHRFCKKDPNRFPILDFKAGESLPTRNVFGKIIEAWADSAADLIGGSADLEPSNMTEWYAKKVGDYTAENPGGRNIVFGVREFPMSAICNGMALYGGLLPFDATFLVFSDYARAAVRLGALQKAVVIHEYSHDSFYLGEDGPTHQPIEHLMSLRLIPDLLVMRPADANETAVLMHVAALSDKPSAICLSRQKMQTLNLNEQQKADIGKGAYVVLDKDNADLLILATGSEVELALAVAAQIKDFRIRVVSMPCWELFEAQAKSYRHLVLPEKIKNRVSIEAGSTLGWQKYTGSDGLNIGIDHFGASAKAEDLAKNFGFTVEAICQKIKKHDFYLES